MYCVRSYNQFVLKCVDFVWYTISICRVPVPQSTLRKCRSDMLLMLCRVKNTPFIERFYGNKLLLRNTETVRFKC